MNKRFTSLLAALVMLAVSLPAWANSQLTVFENGDEMSNTVPVNMVYLDEAGTRAQVLYPAAELAVMNGEPINSMTFYLTDDGITVNGGKVIVSLTETTESAFVNDYITDGLVQVATISFTAGVNELVVNFDTPYTYHGGNLVLDTYVEEATDYSFNLFIGDRPLYYSAITRLEVSKFIPKTTFDYGTSAEYAAKVIPTELTFDVTRAERASVKSVVVKNIGTSPFTPAFSTTAPFGVTAANAVLAAGEEVEVPVTFAPQEEGDYQGMLTIDCGLAGTLQVALNGTAIQAANDLVVGDTTDYAGYLPIYGPDIDIVGTQGQMIYPAAMLADMVGHDILSLRFHTQNEVQMDGGTIQMSFKVVEDTAFAAEEMATDLIAVATAVPVLGGTDLVFDLDEPFTYNGGNLLVSCAVTEAGVTNYRQTFFYGTPMEYNCGIYQSLWYGSNWDIEYVPFMPMATFSFTKDGAPQPQGLRGDVNGDKAVNIADVTALIDYLLSGDATGINLDNANCNLDDGVNIADVTALIDYLLSGNW